MAHLQFIPGDPRLVDQLVYELKSKGIFDQFRKDCIADVDTRPAYQNLRQRVENSVTTFLARQCWMPDLNKNQLREKLRKHILDGNYLEQGVERIVDQVVNPKVASVFIPQVEDLVYNYLGITRKKTTPAPETSNGKIDECSLLPVDLEAVSPGSVKSNDDKNDVVDMPEENKKMEVDETKEGIKEDNTMEQDLSEKVDTQESRLSGISELTCNNSNNSIIKNNISLPEDIKVENIPPPEKSPPDSEHMKIDIDKIRLPVDDPSNSMDIPLPDEVSTEDKDRYFKPVNSDDESSSDSSLIRNMSPLTPIRNFINENSCDAQQAFENQSVDVHNDKVDKPEPSSFRFTIETKAEDSFDAVKPVKPDSDQKNLSYQFANQVNINNFNTPIYEDSSNSNLLHIDYESDPNSKQNTENKIPDEEQNSNEVKKEKKQDERRSSHKSSSNRDSSSKDRERRYSSSKDRRSESKPSSSKENKSDRKSSKDDHKSSSRSSHKERYHDKSDKKDSRDSSKHRSSSHRSSSHKDSKSHKSSSSSHKHSSSSKHSDDKKSSNHKDKDKTSKDEKYSKEKSSKDSKSNLSSHRTEKDKKSSSSSKSKHDDKDSKKKSKKDSDDHYSASGRGSHSRRSTDRDSNDGSSSSKGSQNPSSAKLSDSKKGSKSSVSKSDTTSTNGESTSPSDKDHIISATKTTNATTIPQNKAVRVENHLEMSNPPRLPFVPEVKLRKPKIAANLEEAKKLMKMRKFLDEEQKRMNQEAALLLEFQANVRPSMSQVYSSISGPELEFACVKAAASEVTVEKHEIGSETKENENNDERNDSISDILNAAEQVDNIDEPKNVGYPKETLHVNREIDEESNNNTNTATVVIENITSDSNSIEVFNKTNVLKNKNTSSNKVESSIIQMPKNNLNGKEVKSKDLCNKIQQCNEEFTTSEEIKARETVPESQVNEESFVIKSNEYLNFEVTVIAENLSDNENMVQETTTVEEKINTNVDVSNLCESRLELQYFAEHEKYTAELERDRFSKFLKVFLDTNTEKIYLINCDAYEERIIKEVAESFGNYNIVNYYKNGYLKLNNTAKNIVRNVNISSEIVLPVESSNSNISTPIPVSSPVKSECSFELGSDYDAKLEEMVSKTTKKEILEIILGSQTEDTSEVAMPTIDYCNYSSIESDTQDTPKRKLHVIESSENNNKELPTPNKLRKISGSEEISSTTEESEVTSKNNMTTNNSFVRSKYLGKARRVGLPRPKRNNLPNSPSSDKSIENYEQNTPVVPAQNGKIKIQRNKVQRYDTSDLYKPKLHYLSRRNNIN